MEFPERIYANTLKIKNKIYILYKKEPPKETKKQAMTPLLGRIRLHLPPGSSMRVLCHAGRGRDLCIFQNTPYIVACL